MKHIKRLVTTLRVLGIISLCLSLVLVLYALATNANWGDMRTNLTASGVKTGFTTRVQFDHDYFSALSDAVYTKNETTGNRLAAIRSNFAFYEEQAAAAANGILQSDADDAVSYLENEFDIAAFLERYQARENTADERELAEIFETVDSFSTAAPPKKKLPVKAKSSADFFEEFYASFSADPEKDAGTYLEFMTVVRNMMVTAAENGESVPKAQKWMEESFTEEAYFSALDALRAEEKSEAADQFIDVFAQSVSVESPDFKAILDASYQDFTQLYGEEAGNEALFTLCVRDLVTSTADSKGDYAQIAQAMTSMKAARENASFGSYMTGFCRNTVLPEADKRAKISAVGLLWRLTANDLLMALIGIGLIILAAAADSLLSKVLIRRSKAESNYHDSDDILLRVNHLKQYFAVEGGVTKAVDDVSFYIRKGEVFGLVGESGCGKTTTGRTIINLYDPTEGDIYFEGLRISSNLNGLPTLIKQLRSEAAQKIEGIKAETKRSISVDKDNAAKYNAEAKKQIREIRRALSARIEKAQTTALETAAEKSKCTETYRNRRRAELTAKFEEDCKTLSGEALAERKKRFAMELKAANKEKINTRMQMVFQDPIASINPRMTVREIIAEGLIIRGITDKKYIDEKVYEMLELVGLVREHADRYPHEFSGGQRQRIGIARAIVLEPDLIIADEPISALDVSIQAQVINLLNDLRSKKGLTIMFIAHNLSVVKYFSDRIGVMYYGKLVEMTTSEELFRHPLHPYTKSLLSAIPYPDPHHEKTRKRIEYNPTLAHDYSKEQPTLREIIPGHFILCNTEEFEKYQKEIAE